MLVTIIINVVVCANAMYLALHNMLPDVQLTKQALKARIKVLILITNIEESNSHTHVY